MRVLGIDVSPDLLARWSAWFAPDVQPFLADDELADEVHDTFCLYGPPDGLRHSGVGGLAYVLAEIRETRPWTEEESALASGIASRIRAVLPTQTLATFFDGLVSHLGVLTALGAEGSDAAVTRLSELAGDDGWDQPYLSVPPYRAPPAFSSPRASRPRRA